MKETLPVIMLAVLLALTSCGPKKEAQMKKSTCIPITGTEILDIISKVKQMPLEPVLPNEVAVLETNLGKMVIKFFPGKAPQHCSAFKRLVKAGFYTCTPFHRVIKDFMIQGGDINTRDNDPNNDGSGPGPGYTLPAEFNDTPHDKGILSMARRGDDVNSAGSQFFIVLSKEHTAHLDGQYTVFGQVIEGIDVLEKIGSTPTMTSPVYGQPVMPIEPVVIEKAYMEMQ
jgi:peptidyl-prolyl cis-trans isomerase B (cyclophilin B)